MCGITIYKLHGYVKCFTLIGNCCSVAKSRLTLRPHGLQHARPPCLSPSPRVCSDSFPLSCWCHPTISYSVTHVFSYPKSYLASRSSLISWLLALGGQGIAVSASESSLSNEYSGFISFRIDWFDLLALQGTLKSSLRDSLAPQFKSNSMVLNVLYGSALTSLHD